MENNNRQGCRWTKASEREPSIGDYYYCKVDTKQDCIVKTVVEWGEHRNGDFKYNDWDLDNVSHFGDFGEDAEVIEWLDESIEPCATSSEIEFAEWLGNGFKMLALNNIWECFNDDYCDGKNIQLDYHYTTEQLYTIYQNQKQKVND